MALIWIALSKAAQSVSHQTISANGIDKISAAENPVSAARRFAAIFMT
jgi:hypothetical protein